MEIALIGLPNSGKTTVFNAITGANVEVTPFSGGKFEPHTQIIKVPDERIDNLSKLYNPRRTIYATVKITDIPGIKKGDMQNEKIATEINAYVGKVDALVNVVKAFGDDINIENSILEIEYEFITQDLIKVENRLERINKTINKVTGNEKKKLEFEKNIMEKCKETLDKEFPLRILDFKEEEIKILKSFQFLSLKPLMVLLNCDETTIEKEFDFGKGEKYLKLKNTILTRICGQLEMEISQMDPDEAKEFMNMYGLTEPAKDKVIRELYRLLKLISFFTVGEDEVKAWPILKGTTAHLAAGEIHSDIQKGFIRAEVIKYEDLMKYKDESLVKKEGKCYMQGKDYIVEDGDIIHFLFNK